MKRSLALLALLPLLLLLGLSSAPPARAAEAAGTAEEESKEAKRLDDARAVFQEIRDMPDAEVPQPLLDKCRCVAVFPGVVKGALGFGARRGHGVMSCRDASGKWGPVSFLTLTGGSFGFQIGVEKADVVLFLMSERGARSLTESKFTLGAKAGVAAGPVGRSAEADTDLKLDAEIYSYGRSKGAFAGLSLEGARVGVDRDAIKRFYGRDIEARDIVFKHRVPKRPPSLTAFLGVLP